MPRGVRFEDNVPATPDEFSMPHHADKGLNPRGILLKEGTFEKKVKNGKAPLSRRDRRYSTPVQEIAKMQNTAVHEPSHSRQDPRSRRRSISGGLPDSHHHHHHHHQSDPTPSHSRHSTSRRDSAQPPSRLHSPRSQSFVVTSSHPYGSYATLNRRDSVRWQDDSYRFQAPYDAPTALYYGPETINQWTGYPTTHLQPPPGFVQLYGSSTTQSSTYYSPGSQAESRRLPPDPRPKPSLKDVVVQRHLKNPRITWNIAFPFSSTVFDSRSKLAVSELDATATVPAIDKFTIKFEYSKTQEPLRTLWRSIKVRGSYPYEYEGSTIFLITIRDVVNAIFDFFQIPITREEYAMLTNSEAQRVLHAQRKRMGRHAYGFGDPIRVDLLGDMTRFEGVRISSFKDQRISFGLELGRW